MIALCALLVSIATAILGFAAYRHERGDRKREADDRRREDKRRDKELALLQQQVEGEAEARDAEKRAELLCQQGPRGGVSPGVDEYTVRLHNVGRATAYDVKAWIATETGPRSNPQALGSLGRDQQSPEFKLQISSEDSRNRPRPLFIRASWSDGAGPHDEELEPLASF